MHRSCLQTHQKRAADLITDGCESPCGFWELNSGPLEERSVLLTSEPSLQHSIFLFTLFHCFETGSLYIGSPGCPETPHVDQNGLELTKIRLPLSPECWNYRYIPSYSAQTQISL